MFTRLVFLAAIATAYAVTGDSSAADLTDLPLESLSNTGLAAPSQNVEVATASKYPQRSGEAPATVRLVTAEDIKTYGYRSLGEVLRSLPGVYFTNDRNYSYLGVRGFGRPGDYNTRVLLLVDGMRVNDPIYDSQDIGNEFPVDVDLIERVEFMPGPGSALYGNNALLGVINVVTRHGNALNGARLSGEYGGFETYKGRGSYGRRFDNGAEVLVSATGFDREGPKHLHYREFDTPGQNNGNAQGLDYDRYQNAFGKLSYGGLTLEAGYHSRDKGIPTASFGQTFNVGDSSTRDQRTFLAMNYNAQLGPAWDLLTRLNYQEYHYNGTYAYAGPLNRDLGLARWWGGELRLVNTSFERHKLAFGTEWQDNLQQLQRNVDVGGATYIDVPYSSVRYGFYGEDQFSLLDNLTLIAGARFDHVPLGGGNANPRAGLVWRALDDTTLRLNYGTAFRAPNAFESFYNDQLGLSGYKPGPSLRNEQVDTLELGVDHLLAASTRVGLSTYHYRIQDLISQASDPAGFLSYRNMGNAEAVGVEGMGEHRFQNGARAKLSYTWQTTRDDNGRWLSNSPQHMAKFQVEVPLWKEGWTAAFDTLYMSGRQSQIKPVAGYTLGSLTLNSRLHENADLSFSVYNLWNSRFFDPVGDEFRQNAILQDGRSFRLKLTVGF